MAEPSSTSPLPAPLVEQIVDETTKMALGFFGLEPAPRTAVVFGPAPCVQILLASQEGGINEEVSDGWPFYLVVLQGPFAATRRFPGAPPRSIATLTLTPTAEYPRAFSFRNHLPRAMALLGAPHSISLDPSR